MEAKKNENNLLSFTQEDHEEPAKSNLSFSHQCISLTPCSPCFFEPISLQGASPSYYLPYFKLTGNHVAPYSVLPTLINDKLHCNKAQNPNNVQKDFSQVRHHVWMSLDLSKRNAVCTFKGARGFLYDYYSLKTWYKALCNRFWRLGSYLGHYLGLYSLLPLHARGIFFKTVVPIFLMYCKTSRCSVLTQPFPHRGWKSLWGLSHSSAVTTLLRCPLTSMQLQIYDII